MLSPNSLIFPKPRYRNLQAKIVKIKDYLIYIPKTQHKRRLSHLHDLTSISKDQFAKRFSCCDSIMENISQSTKISAQDRLRKNENKKKIKNAVDKGIKKLRSKSSLNKENKILQERNQFLKRKSSQSSKLTNNIKLTTFSKVKLNEIYSRYTSVKTTARTQIQKEQSKILMQRQFCTNINFSMGQIPCVYFQNQSAQQSNKLLIYYHANGEDLLNSFDFIRALSRYFYSNVLVVEYPGYSLYSNKSQNNSQFKQLSNKFNCNGQQEITQKILSDVPFVMSYIKNIGYDLKNSIVIGRSIGTGPAIEIASTYEIGALILLSPFAKFYEVVQKLYGKVASMIVKQPFNNLAKSEEIKCPVLILHGLQDKIIHYSQSIQLSCKIKTFCSLKLIENMTHNKFHFESDIFQNMDLFFENIEMDLFE